MRLKLNYPAVFKNYQSPASKVNWFPKHFKNTAFYIDILKVVFSAANQAKKGNYDDTAWCNSSYAVKTALEAVGATIEIDNLNSVIEQKGPCVIVGNHMSTMETFLLPWLICPHGKFTYVLKESLVNYPVFKHIAKSINPIVVGRTNPREDFLTVIKQGQKRLEDGYSIAVFPQTTRTTDFNPETLNSIGAKLAKKAKVPLVPLALKTDCWGNGKFVRDFGKVHPEKSIHFSFGTAMEIEGTGKQQHQATKDHIVNHLKQWQKD